MTDTTYSFFGADGLVDCFVTLDGQATAAFAIETVNALKANSWITKLESNLDHASRHRFRVNQPDSGAVIVLKVACSFAPEDGAAVFVGARQGNRVLECMDGTGTLVEPSDSGIHVGTLVKAKTSIFLLRVIA